MIIRNAIDFHISSLVILLPGAIGFGGGLFGEDDLPARLVNVNCTGDELNLIDCPSENQGTRSCESAIAICQCMLL